MFITFLFKMGVKRRKCLKIQSCGLGEINQGFLGDSVIKNLPANAGDISSIPGPGRFPKKQMQSTPICSPGGL